jgi:biotin carboxyl carrier protein
VDVAGWVGAVTAVRTMILRDERGQRRVTVVDLGTVRIEDGPEITAEVRPDGAIRLGDAPARTAWSVAAGDVRWVFLDGEVYRFEVERDGPRKRAAGQHGTLTAPMPATVLSVHVSPGDVVKAGDTLIILEAMKMELPVRAPAGGCVTAVHCQQGELVQPGLKLIEIDET